MPVMAKSSTDCRFGALHHWPPVTYLGIHSPGAVLLTKDFNSVPIIDVLSEYELIPINTIFHQLFLSIFCSDFPDEINE